MDFFESGKEVLIKFNEIKTISKLLSTLLQRY